MAEFLMEVFSEEIPARMQKQAAEDLTRLLDSRLKDVGLKFDKISHYVTPRRITVVVGGLPTEQPLLREERRGPRVDAPKAALDGFLRSNNIHKEQLEERKTPKGEFYFAVVETPGKLTKLILPEIIEEVLRQLPWQKSMRWGLNSFRWIRPLHHVLAIFNGTVLEGAFELGHDTLFFTDETRGHRFMAPTAVKVSSFADYEQKLKESFVIIDREERKLSIRREGERLAAEQNLILRQDETLLEEVCGLVEWPNTIMGRIDEEFLEVPSEVLISAMRSHQKYFSLENSLGELAPFFIAVSNMPFDQKRNRTTIAGNEKVLRARLSDARFFWKQDLESKLETRVEALANINFYERLGSLADKTVRLQNLVRVLCEFIPRAKKEYAQRAARLAKADLTTAMVNEFPDLQGIMGGHYAKIDGEVDSVCSAISGHYAPQGPSDACPTEPVTIAVALADKLDSLVGFFAIDEKPTGSKDPFALRRSALGVIRLITENKLRIPLTEIIGKTLEGYPKLETSNKLLEFINERMKIHLRSEGVSKDLIAAIVSVGEEDDLCRLVARINALDNFLKTDDGANLLVAHRRAANICAIESKKDKTSYVGAPNPEIFEIEEEKVIAEVLKNIQERVAVSLGQEDYEAAMHSLATLRVPLDRYFERVTVNAEHAEVRRNRLECLALIVSTMNRVADFSILEN